MSLLKTAVKARIPLIAARTDDPRGFGAVVEEITGKPVIAVKLNGSKLVPGQAAKISSVLNKKQIGIMEWEELNWKETLNWLEENNAILIVVNPERVDHRMLDVGFVSVPVQLIANYVEERTNDDPGPYVAALSGLSLNNIDRISRMATAEYGEFTPKALRAIRKMFFQTVRGIEEVATEQIYYSPEPRIEEWLMLEGKLFKLGTPALLTPRGFLFKGPPGTGKTSGAKYIANQLKVPLYRLDVGSLLSKWVGESDAQLKTALKQVESFEPCVLLLDEVEKLFEAGTSSDVVPRLLGYLLWWLQEHNSKVLTIMTTNHVDKLPPELYREGRIDEVIEFIGISSGQVASFVHYLAESLKKVYPLTKADLFQFVEELTHDKYNVIFPQAGVTEKVLRLIKVKIVQSMQE